MKAFGIYLAMGLLLLTIWPRQGRSQSLQWQYYGTRQMGMGFVGAALTDDAGAAAYNPAGMAFSRQSGLQVGSSAVRSRTYFAETFPSIYLDSTIAQTLTPLYLNTVLRFPARENPSTVALGLSLHQPFGSSVAWDDQWKGKFISQEFSLNTYFLQGSLSLRLQERLGIALGGSYGVLTLLSRRALRDTDGQNLELGSLAISGSDATWGLFVGIYAELNEQLSLGAVLRSPMPVQIENGTADFTVPESLQEIYEDQAVAVEFWLPPRLELGLCYEPEPRLLIGIDLNIAGWALLDSLRFDFAADPEPPVQAYPEKNYRNSTAFRAGAEWAWSEQLHLRGGLFFENTFMPNEWVSPELPDASRIGLSAGLGWRLWQHLSLDLAYQFAFTGERSAVLTAARFGGTYVTRIQGLSAALSYNW